MSTHSVASSSFVPGLWGTLSKQEKAQISEKVKADGHEKVGAYVNRHADEFLPSIEVGDLKKSARADVEDAVKNGQTLESAIRSAAATTFEGRIASVEGLLQKGITSATDASQRDAHERALTALTNAKTPEEQQAALHQAKLLIKGPPVVSVNPEARPSPFLAATTRTTIPA